MHYHKSFKCLTCVFVPVFPLFGLASATVRYCYDGDKAVIGRDHSQVVGSKHDVTDTVVITRDEKN